MVAAASLAAVPDDVLMFIQGVVKDYVSEAATVHALRGGGRAGGRGGGGAGGGRGGAGGGRVPRLDVRAHPKGPFILLGSSFSSTTSFTSPRFVTRTVLMPSVMPTSISRISDYTSPGFSSVTT